MAYNMLPITAPKSTKILILFDKRYLFYFSVQCYVLNTEEVKMLKCAASNFLFIISFNTIKLLKIIKYTSLDNF